MVLKFTITFDSPYHFMFSVWALASNHLGDIINLRARSPHPCWLLGPHAVRCGAEDVTLRLTGHIPIFFEKLRHHMISGMVQIRIYSPRDRRLCPQSVWPRSRWWIRTPWPYAHPDRAEGRTPPDRSVFGRGRIGRGASAPPHQPREGQQVAITL